MYRSATTSIEGFVQQLAVGYVATGHYFYVTGTIPANKDPDAVARKLIDRYQIDASKWARARRKRSGQANAHYLRYGHFFVIIATHGEHRFFSDEPLVRDIREDPIAFNGYSIGCGKGRDGKWHASVRIHARQYSLLKAHFLELAVHRSTEALIKEFRSIRFAPFAKVRRQMLNILRAVNRVRRVASFEPVPVTALRLRRVPVRPFQELAARIAA